jgi:hypothetical protein
VGNPSVGDVRDRDSETVVNNKCTDCGKGDDSKLGPVLTFTDETPPLHKVCFNIWRGRALEDQRRKVAATERSTVEGSMNMPKVEKKNNAKKSKAEKVKKAPKIAKSKRIKVEGKPSAIAVDAETKAKLVSISEKTGRSFNDVVRELLGLKDLEPKVTSSAEAR